MKIGLCLYTPDFKNRHAENGKRALEMVSEASAKGADLVLTPEEALFERTEVEAYWDNPSVVVSTVDQLAPYKKLAKESENTIIGVGFVEFSKDGIFNSYALVGPGVQAIRRKTFNAEFDGWIYLKDPEKMQVYGKALKPNGGVYKFEVGGKPLEILPLICREVVEDTEKVLTAKNPADLVVVGGYGLDFDRCNKARYMRLVNENVLKPNGIVAYCDGFDPFGKIYQASSELFYTTEAGVHVFEVDSEMVKQEGRAATMAARSTPAFD